MELFVFLIILFFGSFIVRAVIAGGKSVVTGDSFSESMRGIPDFKIRLKDTRIDSIDADCKEVQIKGLIPVSRPTNIGFVVLLTDVTNQSEQLEGSHQFVCGPIVAKLSPKAK